MRHAVFPSLALAGTLLVTSATAKTVITLPPPQPPAVAVGALGDELLATYLNHCLPNPESLALPAAVVEKYCEVLDVLVAALRHEQARLCATPHPQPEAIPPGCPPDTGVTIPSTDRVE